MLGAAFGTAFRWAVYLLVYRRDRRRVRNGVLLLIALHSSLSTLARLVSSTLPMGNLLVFTGARSRSWAWWRSACSWSSMG